MDRSHSKMSIIKPKEKPFSNESTLMNQSEKTDHLPSINHPKI